MDAPPIEVIEADYADPAQAAAVLLLLDAYAREPTGAGAPLADAVRGCLIAEMRQRPFVFSLLAMAGPDHVGLANCIESFSTFAARLVVNIHDLYVTPEWRGRGVVQALLAGVERVARARGGVAVTLEVLADNVAARRAYERAGFGASGAGMLFWKKPLCPRGEVSAGD